MCPRSVLLPPSVAPLLLCSLFLSVPFRVCPFRFSLAPRAWPCLRVCTYRLRAPCYKVSPDAGFLSVTRTNRINRCTYLRKSGAKSHDNKNQRPATTIRSSPMLWAYECAPSTLEPRTQITKHCLKCDHLARSHVLNCHMESVTLHSHNRLCANHNRCIRTVHFRTSATSRRTKDIQQPEKLSSNSLNRRIEACDPFFSIYILRQACVTLNTTPKQL